MVPEPTIGIQVAYLVASILFIVGLKFLSSPRHARNGNLIAAAGMILAVGATRLDGGGPGGVAVCRVGSLAFGVFMVIPIGGAGRPVVISLLNAFTGLAAASTGFALDNRALIISGTLVGASGTLLTRLMCK